MKTIKLKTIEKQIRKYQKLLKKPSRYNAGRKLKISILEEKKATAKKINRYAKRKTFSDQQKADLKNLKNKYAELNKELKRGMSSLTNKLKDINDVLNDSYYENDRFIKGLKYALKDAGFIKDVNYISQDELYKIMQYFDVKGISFSDVIYLLEKYNSQDIDELFYASDRDRELHLFNGQYFTSKLNTMIGELRTQVDDFYNAEINNGSAGAWTGIEKQGYDRQQFLNNYEN